MQTNATQLAPGIDFNFEDDTIVSSATANSSDVLPRNDDQLDPGPSLVQVGRYGDEVSATKVFGKSR